MIKLAYKPFVQPSDQAPPDDYEAEGFAYLSSIGAKVDGHSPEALWRLWHSHAMDFWVVRFEVVSIEEWALQKYGVPPAAGRLL